MVVASNSVVGPSLSRIPRHVGGVSAPHCHGLRHQFLTHTEKHQSPTAASPTAEASPERQRGLSGRLLNHCAGEKTYVLDQPRVNSSPFLDSSRPCRISHLLGFRVDVQEGRWVVARLLDFFLSRTRQPFTDL